MEIDETAAERDAAAAAEAWLALVDAAQWRESLARLHTVFGRTLHRGLSDARYTTSVSGAPDGEYVVMEYAAELERKQEAVETVVAMRDEDGAWRVGGYFVR